MTPRPEMKVGTKLALGFGLLIAFILTLTTYASVALSGLSADITRLTDDRMPKIEQLFELKDNANLSARAVRNLVLLSAPAEQQAELKRIQEAFSRIDGLSQRLGQTIVLPEGIARLGRMVEAQRRYAAALNQVVELGLADKDEEATAKLLKEVRPLQTAYFDAIGDTVAFQQEMARATGQAAKDAVATATRVFVMLTLAAMLIGGTCALLITRRLIRQLGAEPATVTQLAKHVAEGDLSVHIDVRHGDASSLMASMKAMRDSLAHVVANVRQNSENVATASAQIAQGNNDLSQRTEEQASALQQTAASMEELSSTVRQNADSAMQANELARKAAGVATEGGSVVGQVVDTMQGINESSRRISDIITVIDGIAFQTNILALNAAVEAARAGEQGRGFAVVAGEVRSLAQRSAAAAKEIKGLISTSVERVEQGSALVDQAGATMSQIVDSIRHVTDIMGGISTASHEQRTGVEQISEAVSQMDQATQQNAALVEESAAAAESLKQQAQQLVRAVSVFRLSSAMPA